MAPKASLIEDQWHPNLQGYVILGTQWTTVLQSVMVGQPGRHRFRLRHGLLESE